MVTGLHWPNVPRTVLEYPVHVDYHISYRTLAGTLVANFWVAQECCGHHKPRHECGVMNVDKGVQLHSTTHNFKDPPWCLDLDLDFRVWVWVWIWM